MSPSAVFRRAFELLLVILSAVSANAQCPNNNTVQGSAITVPCPGSVSGGCIIRNRYALVNVVSGRIYTFSVCNAPWNTNITLYNNTGGSTLGYNIDGCNTIRSSMQWTATYTGSLRVLLDRRTCDGSLNTTCADLWITCGLNDDPCTAVALTVGPSCSNTVGTNVGASNNTAFGVPSCSNYGGGDVWFRFVAPASGQVNITGSTVSGSSLTDGAMAVYTATGCSGTLTEIACNEDSPLGGLMPAIALAGLTSGTTYYIRFWEYGNDAFGPFNICVTTPAAPANDNPCGAVSLTVGASCSNTLGTTAGATNTTGPPAPGCGNYLGGDVWFKAVAPASGRLTINTSAAGGSALTDAAMAVYSAPTCGGTMTLVSCNDDAGASTMPGQALSGLTPSATYYIRVWAKGNTSFGGFNICAFEPIVNDEPCGAVLLTVGSSCSLTSSSNAAATLSSAAQDPGCGNLSGSSRDVWFRFVVPASGIVIIQSTAGTLTDGAMALYAGSSCSASGLQLLDCSDDEGPGYMPFLRYADLVPGDTYYLRYWGYGSGNGTFNLCVWSPTMPVGKTCVYMLELFDSGENGWGTSAVQVVVNGGTPVNYTVTGYYTVALIGLNTNDLFQTSYVNTGPNQNQNRYQIRQVPGGFGVLSQGPSPANGMSLFEVVDCIPPPAPKEDCRGATPICGSQTFNDNPAGTGFDADLRYTTYGCLSTSERQGTWYKFTPSASGTLGLTISPTNSGDDYDFAIWGPETSVICPPYKQPKRCSYSGAFGDTGLRTSDTDTTETPSGNKWVAAMEVVVAEIYVMYISNYSQSGLSFTLSWQLTNGAELDCLLLPVEFIALEADLMDEHVEVTWSTASESNASHYIVERSTDAFDYFPIGRVEAMGNTSSETHYSFLDEAPEEGLNYYRVQQVDADGTSTTSPADYAIYRRGSTEMVVFPNPAGDLLYASFELYNDSPIIWRILDSTGRLVEQDLYQGTKGNMLIDVPLERLPAGSYTLLVNDPKGSMNRSAHFIKQ